MTRISMGALGAGLVAYGISRRDRLGALYGSAGALVLLRDIVNRPYRRVLGIGVGRRAVDFQKTLTVNARAAGPRLGKEVQTAIRASKSGDWSISEDGAVTASERCQFIATRRRR